MFTLKKIKDMEYKRELIEDYISWFFEYAWNQSNELETILNMLDEKQLKELHKDISTDIF